MRIRQAVLVARDLDAVLADLCAVFAIEVAFHDPGVAAFGLRNGVMPVGEQFLEVVSPAEAGTTAGRYLERRGGDGGYMVIFQTRDLAAARRRLAGHQVRTVWEIALDDIETAHLHPRDTGGAIVSVDEARPWESWRWAGPRWRDHVRTGRVSGIAGLEIQSEAPAGLAKRWSEIFGLPLDGSGLRLATGDGGHVSFCEATDGRGEGLRTILLRAVDAKAIRETAASRGLEVDSEGAVTIGGARFALARDDHSA